MTLKQHKLINPPESSRGNMNEVQFIMKPDSPCHLITSLWMESASKYNFMKYTWSGAIKLECSNMGKLWFVKQQITPDILEDFLLWNVDPFQGPANLFLPKSYKFVNWVFVSRSSYVQNFVQGSWVFHCSDCIAGDVFFHVIDCCILTRWNVVK